MLESIQSADRARCVDFFEDPSGGFGFEHFRADPEDGGRWTVLGSFGATRYESAAEAVDNALGAIDWLERDAQAAEALANWSSRCLAPEPPREPGT